MWQQLHEELAPLGLTIIAVALDADVSAVREWVDAAGTLSLPILIDPTFVLAERLGIINVPASVWIDEHDRIVRPPDTAMGDDRFRQFSRVDSSVHHDELRAWVRDGTLRLSADEVRAHLPDTTDDLQRARLHRRLAVALRDRGDDDGAREHLLTARSMAPMDWTIRRGSMPLVGEDPFGQEFFDFVGEWMQAGGPGYSLATGRDA